MSVPNRSQVLAQRVKKESARIKKMILFYLLNVHNLLKTYNSLQVQTQLVKTSADCDYLPCITVSHYTFFHSGIVAAQFSGRMT